MTTFSATNKSAATLRSARPRIWAALIDPELLAKLTPYLHQIDVDGDSWTWHLTRVPLLGSSIVTTFTEVMTFEEPRRITYRPDPRLADQKTLVYGDYLLEEVEGGTRVSIEMTVSADLPFPAVMRRPVEGALAAVMAGMGRRFGSNLLRHLGEK